MFVSTMFIALSLAGDPVAAPKPAPRFEFSRLYQWMFSKRPSPSKEPMPPKPNKAESDLSDARVELRCRSNVFNEPALRNSGMTVRVSGGVAHLEGQSQSRWLRLRAEQLAAKTPGVIRVENNLRIGDAIDLPAMGTPESQPETVVENASASSQSNWEVLASRPRTLGSAEGEPVVTTYAIRKPKDSQTTLNRTSTATAGSTKAGVGKLIPWNDSEPLPIPAGELIPRATSKRTALGDPVDEEIKKIIAETPNAKSVTFERVGREVVLRGSAPSSVLFAVAEDLGRLPGVATVKFEPKKSDAGPHKPSTSDIE